MSDLYLVKLYYYSLNCGTSPVGTLGCDTFWGVFFAVAILVCAIVFIHAAHYLYKERIAFLKYQQKLIDREKIADDQTLDSVKWNPDNSYDGLSFEDIAEKFRNQLNQK